MGTIAFNGEAAVAAVSCKPGTPAPTDPYPGKTAAATNFESGTLSPFTPFTAVTGTVSVSSASSHSPGCSAFLHATTDNGSIAKMSVGLTSGMKEAYADGWFNVAKEGVAGNDVPYFRFFSGGIRYLDVFRHNISNDLVVRVTSPTGFIYTTVVPTVALGTWHHLVMHVVPKGTSTGVQIWWDGQSVFASNKVNITAPRFDTVQLGAEHDQQKGDLYVDDVIINSGSGTPGPVPGILPGPGGGGGGGGGGTVPPAATTDIQAVAAANPDLGTSTAPINCGQPGGGCYQDYPGGAIIWSAATGAHPTSGDVRAAWARTGFLTGFMGYPTGDVVCGQPGGGCYQNYQGGAIIWSAATGAHPTSGDVRAAWARTGFLTGFMGYPTGDVVCGQPGGGCYQNYQGGAIIWSAATGAHPTSGDVRAAWARTGFLSGFLRYPTGDVVCGQPGGGCYQNYQGGAIIWSAGTGAHPTSGDVRAAWARTGFLSGFMGYPTGDVVCGQPGGGCYQNYQGGAIIWSAGTGAHPTSGDVRAAWARTGFLSGFLRYPTGDVVCGQPGGGCYQNYQGGAIIWSAGTGAHPTSGDVRAAWARTGFLSGFLRYPTGDVVCGQPGGGCYQNYQGGAIIWSAGTGAHPTGGAIRIAWASTGFLNGRLGYPTSDEHPIGGGSVAQSYQGGQISWSPVTGTRIS
ncbi:hypothetical protein [Pseudarthrobacter albicanus]|uniref:hypothetical protein n=1 Tax=Pseudarthrobacter albicanus TaxID=2823873 RepID=UPI001FE4D149|nr:hypothetical protein [Pseudarthrobacter albicanus]